MTDVMTSLESWFPEERMDGPFYGVSVTVNGSPLFGLAMDIVRADPDLRARIESDCPAVLDVDAVAALAECFSREEAEALAEHLMLYMPSIKGPASITQRFATAEDAAGARGFLGECFGDALHLCDIGLAAEPPFPIRGVLDFRGLAAQRAA